jgi:GxxExxY protein
MQVHRDLGPGFLEAVYQEALAIRFECDGIPFHREVPFAVVYEGRQLDAAYRADFLCYDGVIVELKAHATGLGHADWAQVLNYMRAGDLRTGLLLNFGTPSLQFKRFIWTPRENLRDRSSRAADVNI